jgi:casein kinase 1
MNYVRKLGFEEVPDYDFLRELFSKVLKNASEVEDGVYDWMLLNSGKGWEAGHVRIIRSSRAALDAYRPQSASQVLAQAHANAGTPTPHRERREDRERRTSRRPPVDAALASPSSAHLKPTPRRPADSRGPSRGDTSIQPLAPVSRRGSQQQVAQQQPRDGPNLHPYAAAPSGPYKHQPAYTPAPAVAASSTGALGNGASDSFRYGGPAPAAEAVARGNMAVYDRGLNERDGGDDEHGGPRRRGFLGLFCCA